MKISRFCLVVSLLLVGCHKTCEQGGDTRLKMFSGYEASVQYERVSKRLEMAGDLRAFIERERLRGENGAFYVEAGEADLRELDEVVAGEMARWPLTPKEAGGPADAEQMDVRDFGAKGDGVADDAPAFQKAFDAIRVRAGRPTVLRVPNGTYAMRTAKGKHQFSIEGLTNCVVLGESAGNVKIRFGIYDHIGGCYIRASDNVTVKNLEFAWEKTPFLQGRILSVDLRDATVTIRRKANTLSPTDPCWTNTTKGAHGDALNLDKGGIRYFCGSMHDPVSGRIDPECGWMFYLAEADVLGNDEYRLYFDPSKPNTLDRLKVGCDLVVPNRSKEHQCAVGLGNCSFCTFDSCIVRNSRGASFASGSSYMPTFVRCRIEPNLGLALSSDADGCISTRGTYLAHCDFRAMHDDGCNITGRGVFVNEVVSPRTILCDCVDSFGGISAGDFFQLTNPFTGCVVGWFRAVSVTQIEWYGRAGYSIVADRDLPTGIVTWRTLGGAEKVFDYKTLKRIHAGRAKVKGMPTQIYCRVNKGVFPVVSDCRFWANRGCGIVIQTANALVEDSYACGQKEGVRVGSLCRYTEGPAPFNVIVRRNEIEDCVTAICGIVNCVGGKPSQEPVMRGVRWMGNVIRRSVKVPVSLKSFDACDWVDNQIIGGSAEIVVDACGVVRGISQ